MKMLSGFFAEDKYTEGLIISDSADSHIAYITATAAVTKSLSLIF
jgi:hypothetical protein